ncbi:uncharacterized protein LOC134366389 isoform X1 [Cynocephalus volans]|uniref:uncharacterized protein LOC134366389 isoform X1 n=1 Tax=Cynocephalus volans TaxID=110931 RepID=UPI002FC872A4
MAAPSMRERQACWGARDEYWKCLDENTEDAARCRKLRSSFESSCPQQWGQGPAFDPGGRVSWRTRSLSSQGTESPPCWKDHHTDTEITQELRREDGGEDDSVLQS